MSEHPRTPSAPQRPRAQRREQARRAHTVPIGVVVGAALVVVGGGYAWFASQQVTPPPDAPMPEKTYTVPVESVTPIVEPDGAFPTRESGYQPRTIDLTKVGASSVAVPALGVEARYTISDKGGDNVWDIPDDIHLTSLLDNGVPIDAKDGTRIIAGHVDHVGQGPGALHDIYLAQPGTVVVTTDAQRTQKRWVVTSVRTAVKEGLPADLWQTDGPARLALVTCGGPVIKVNGVNQYRDNVIVVAEPTPTKKST